MISVFRAVLIVGAMCVLAACGATGSGSQVPVSKGPTTVVKGNTPVQLYSHIARQVHTCWLNPSDPVLTRHVFRAEAPAGGGRGGQAASIVIHDKTRDKKLGLKAFSIDFRPVRDGTQIVTQNHNLPYALGQKLVSDVGYWAQGGGNCDGPAQSAGIVPRGSVAGPRVSR